MSDVHDRLDRLESRLEQQQDRIDQQQETIREQRERIADLEGDDPAGRTADESECGADDQQPAAVNRRTALKAGGLLALLFGGVGTASADSQGQVGTASDPLTKLYADAVRTGTVGSTAGEGLTFETDDGTTALSLGVPTGDGTHTAGGNVVAGHPNNEVTDSAVGAVVGGGGNDGSDGNNVAGGNYAAVAGGLSNTAGGRYAAVGGGDSNTASDEAATVGGGSTNTANSSRATVGGGLANTAGGIDATVGGGQQHTASGSASTIAGGAKNTASGESATVGGGGDISSGDVPDSAGGGTRTDGNQALDDYCTVAGGLRNQAGSDDDSGGNSDRYATVSGGVANTASGRWATVSGGEANTASGRWATVNGGDGNTASGDSATVPSGRFGAAENDYSFVWNDSTEYHEIPGGDGLSSSTAVSGEPVTGANTFSVSARNGVRFVTADDQFGANASVTYIDGGTAGWSTTSSRTAKTNIDPVDAQRVLDGVTEMEVATWEYEGDEGEGQGTRYVGPMAEDFHDVVDVGTDDGSINSINADGVAFAAIQGLAERLDEKTERIDDLETENEQKDARIDDLEAENEQLRERLDAIEERLGMDATAGQQGVADD